MSKMSKMSEMSEITEITETTNYPSNIVDMNPLMDILSETINQTSISTPKHTSTQSYEKKKFEFINNHVSKLLLPYYFYLYIMMSDDNIYKKIKKNQKKKDKELNEINLYFLMEIINKKIEGLDHK
jgi:hypothetical protein